MTADWDDSNFIAQATVTREWVQQAMVAAAETAGTVVLNRSLEMVPRSTDTLAASGYYNVQQTADDVSIEVGYGGNGDPINPISHKHASEYAVYVHEDLTKKHPLGQAKYLETAIDEYQDRLSEIFAEEILSRLK